MNFHFKSNKIEGAPDEQRIVYVRPMDVAELPEHIQAQAGELKMIYGVFGANGEQIAFTPTKSTAFHLARNNELTPVSVH